LRYIWLMIGVLYLSAGLGKVTAAWNSHWLDAVNLRNIIRRRWIVQRLYSKHFSMPSRFDDLPPILISMCGLGTIVFETSIIVLVFFRDSRWLVILCGLAFHVANGEVLGIWFNSLMIAYVFMIDWAWLSRVVMKRVGRKPVVVIYDGGCELCRRVIAILKTLDIANRLTPIGTGISSDPRRARYPQITDEMAARDLYVVREGTLEAGYDAYVIIADCIPFLWPLALIMRFPPVAAIGARYYRHVADSRHCKVEQDGEVEQAVARSAPPEVVRKDTHLTLHLVGLLLLAGEAGTVALNSGFAFRLIGIAVGSESAAQSYADWQKVKWDWPFDQYPTFAYSWHVGIYRTWEPRLVYADGTEVTISSEVFARAFANHMTVAEENAQQAINNRDPVERREQARDIAAMLWKSVPKSAKSSVIAINGYETVFSTDPDVIQPISRRLIDTFPIHELPGVADQK
jgi:predicted DCC family thiol-disulfide oxidoreductase YuxK